MTNNKNMTKPVISLLRENFGIRKVSSVLKITDKDNLYTTYRKIADFIWKNGEWTEEDYATAIADSSKYTSLFDDLIIKPEDVVAIDPKDDSAIAMAPNTGKIKRAMEQPGSDIKVFFYKGVHTSDNTEESGYYAVDFSNKFGTKHNTSYVLRFDKSVKWKVGNANRLIGYSKLSRNIVTAFFDNLLEESSMNTVDPSDSLQLSKTMREQLRRLSLAFWRNRGDWSLTGHTILELFGAMTYEEFIQNTTPIESSEKGREYSVHGQDGTVNRIISVTEDDWKKYRLSYQALSFIQDYIDKTYNIIRFEKYERDIDKLSKTPVFLQKKNINDATRRVMRTTQLNHYFASVELDNDVDLNLFRNFEPELMRLMKLLPKPTDNLTLRLRKLGNYRASGLFVPSFQTLIIDFRTPNQIYSSLKGKDSLQQVGMAGYSSFIHEYGHYLDYNLSQDEHCLSLEKDFSRILRYYTEQVKKRKDEFPSSGKYGLDYFITATEVFARGFELYLWNKGLRSNLIGNENEYLNKIEYQCFTPLTQKMIENYFDGLEVFKGMNNSFDVDLTVESENEKSESIVQLCPPSSEQSRLNLAYDLVEHKVSENLTEYLLF